MHIDSLMFTDGQDCEFRAKVSNRMLGTDGACKPLVLRDLIHLKAELLRCVALTCVCRLLGYKVGFHAS